MTSGHGPRAGATQAPAPLEPRPRMSAWRFVMAFGTVSLLMDFVYEGARSVTGPLLAHLGASALVVGVVTGAGEGVGLVLRLGSGRLADRSGRFWAWTISGYALTVAAVPVLGLTGVLWVAAVLVVAERVCARRPRTRCSRTPRRRPAAAVASPCMRRWTRSAP
ncbi:hypothetical protein [Actinacidiphila acidipaludis]|uniref:Major facilitator superfamily (MFS) profile domain-containing protein n=1 Tax=Actinacidiphila acidipaludis TaxID=2873382 RepID=A0ABS7Q9U5_9ACTN|nr:hypothetical protein [Streptomyces acidipaludis]MBY8879928.1 hypothetical protein [Streptomyces acidipaludis]